MARASSEMTNTSSVLQRRTTTLSTLSLCKSRRRSLGQRVPDGGDVSSLLKIEGMATATALMGGSNYNVLEFTMMNVTVSLTPKRLDAAHSVYSENVSAPMQ